MTLIGCDYPKIKFLKLSYYNNGYWQIDNCRSISLLKQGFVEDAAQLNTKKTLGANWKKYWVPLLLTFIDYHKSFDTIHLCEIYTATDNVRIDLRYRNLLKCISYTPTLQKILHVIIWEPYKGCWPQGSLKKNRNECEYRQIKTNDNNSRFHFLSSQRTQDV